MAATRTPRSRWVDEGLRALADGGPEAVRIEALAKALGVTKGGFYWHFDDRAALLDEVLDAWERDAVDAVIERIEAEGGDGRERLQRLFALAVTARGILKTELAVRDWARRDERVGARLRRADNRRMDYLRSLFAAFISDADEVEARCLAAMSLFIGIHFTPADLRGRRSEVVERALRRLAEPA